MRAGLASAAAVAGLGAAAGLAGCSGGDEKVSAEPANPSAGKLGGKLVLYTSCSESLINAAVPAFMQDMGVAVSVVRGTTSELMARLEADAAAGARVADVVWGGDASWYEAAPERFATYVAGENGAMREGCRNASGVCTPVTREVAVLVRGSGSAANAAGAAEGEGADRAAGADAGTDEAGATAEPAVPRDVTGYTTLFSRGLADCAYEDPAVSEAGLLHLASLSASLGASDANAPWRWAQELSAVGVVAAEDEAGDGEPVLSVVDEGAAAWGLGLEQSCLAAAREGHAVEAVYPAEGEAVSCGCTAIVRDCANLSQAQVWVDYVVGQGCQQVLVSEAAARPVRADVNDPEGVPEVPDPKTVDREGLLATWASVVDGTWEPVEEPAEEAAVSDTPAAL